MRPRHLDLWAIGQRNTFAVFVNAQDEEDDTDIEGSDLPKIKSKIVADTQTDADTLHREELVCCLVPQAPPHTPISSNADPL